EKKFEKAKICLEEIEKENSLYPEAEKLLREIDSLESLSPFGDEQTLKSQMERELESFREGFKSDIRSESIQALQFKLILFGAWALMIKEGEKSNNSEINHLTKRLRDLVEKKQEKELPLFRKEYARLASQL